MSYQHLPYIVHNGHADSIDLWLRTDPILAVDITHAVLNFGDYQIDSYNSNNVTISSRTNNDGSEMTVVTVKPGLEEIPSGDYRCKLIVYNNGEWKDGFVWDDSIEIGLIE